jgi:hypothetical protein
MTDLILILAGTGFLALIVLAAFTVIVVSIHRTERVALSETRGNRAGAIARYVLTGIGTEDEEDGK